MRAPRLGIVDPRTPLLRVIVFAMVALFTCLVLYREVGAAFATNPGLNGLIVAFATFGVGLGIVHASQIGRCVRWFELATDARAMARAGRAPLPLIAFQNYLGSHSRGSAVHPITANVIVESVMTRLSSGRDWSHRLINLVIFLGLLGTFWGLLQSLAAMRGILFIGRSADSYDLVENMMEQVGIFVGSAGIAFSSSLFGFFSAFVLAFVDALVRRAEDRFVFALEDWLTSPANTDEQPNARQNLGDTSSES